MLDYSNNSFQRQSFILNYDIDDEDKTIMVNYADHTTQILPYTTDNEKMLLYKMKKQITNARNTYESAKSQKLSCQTKNKIYLIYFAFYLTFIFNHFYNGIPVNNILLFSSAGVTLLAIKRFYENKKQEKGIRIIIDDYEKHLLLQNEEESFSNEKVLKPNVIENTNEKVKYIISSGIISDTYDELQDYSEDDIALVDYAVFDCKDKTSNEELIKEYLDDGYFEINREIPFINENTLDYLNYQELKELKKLTSSNQNARGKVLVKINKEHINQGND